MNRALVVGDGSAAYVLPALRSLGRAGWTVAVGQPEGGLAAASRWCAAVHSLPVAEHDPQGWLEAVATTVRQGRYDVVFPADDIELLALSAGRDHVPALVPYPEHEVVLAAVDKWSLTQAALAAGLGAPITRPATADAVAQVQGPVVVKARLHWSPGQEAGSERHLPVQVATGSDEVRAAVDMMRHGGGDPVLQELLNGTLMAVSVVLDRDGRPRAAVQQVTERSSLRRTSARARTTTLDEDLLEGVVRMLQDLGWWGLANLQFLRPADGQPRLIDMNARFYGSLALAIGAGADLPRAWAQVALRRDPGPMRTGRAGVRFSALDEDLLVDRAAESGRLRAAVASVRYATGARHSVWDPTDPGPLARRMSVRARRVARRLRKAGS